MANACTNGIDTGFVALGYAKVAVLGVVQGITEGRSRLGFLSRDAARRVRRGDQLFLA